MKNLSVIVVLGFVLLVAGCAGTSRPVTVSASDGLQIKEFSADRADIFSSETVVLDLEVENVGGTKAENVVAKLFGGISGWGGDATAEKTMGRGSGNALSAPTADQNIPGDFNRKTWTVKAPDLAQGLIQTYDLGMRVRYDYSTTSITQIDVISYDQFDLLRRQGSFTQGLTVTQNSNGPIKISLEGRAPMRPDSPGGSVEESLILTITNVGTGVTFRDTGTANDFPTQVSLGRVTFAIETSKGNDALKCDIGDGALVNTGTVTLRRGVEEVRIPCILRIDAGKVSAGVPKETMTATITAGYSYAIDGMAQVKVTSIRDTVAGLPGTPSGGATTTTVPGGTTTTTVPDDTGPVMGAILPLFSSEGNPQYYMIQGVYDPDSGVRECTITDPSGNSFAMTKQGSANCKGSNANDKCDFIKVVTFPAGEILPLTVTCTNGAGKTSPQDGRIMQLSAATLSTDVAPATDTTATSSGKLITNYVYNGRSATLIIDGIQDRQSGIDPNSCKLMLPGDGNVIVGQVNLQGPLPCQSYACSGTVNYVPSTDSSCNPISMNGPHEYKVVCTNRAGTVRTLETADSSIIYFSNL